MTLQILTMKTLTQVFQPSQKTLTMKGHQPHGGFGKIWIRKFIYVLFHISYHSIFACLAFIWQGNITSHSPNPPPLPSGETLSAREPKGRILLTDPDNIGIEILILYSVALISNIVLLTAEALTGEPNYKELSFNEELSLIND